MKKSSILILLFVTSISINAQLTFQKYIQSTHPGFVGVFGNAIGYDPLSSSIYVQANGHSGGAVAPGFMKLDTCGNVITSSFLNSIGTMWTGDASYLNGTFSSVLRTDGGGVGGFTSYIVNYDNTGNITSTNGVNTNASAVVDLHLVGIKTLPNGDILSTGYGPRTNNFKDIYCCKLSPTGQIIWGFYTGQNDNYWENGWGCDYDPVNMDCYFVGQNISFSATNSTDIHIVKTDPAGNMLWEKNIATPATDVGWDVKGLPNHDVIIVASTTNNGAGREEISLIRLDQNGNLIWSYKYTAPGQNNIIRKVTTLPNGNLLLTGYTNSFGAGGYDALNMEIDLNGNIVWQQTYGSADDDYFEGATVVNNSLVSVGMRNFGNTAGTGYQVYLVKSKLDGTFTDASCNASACNFVRQAENYNVFNASNILASGAPVAVVSTTTNLPTNSTIICGKPQALYATLPSTVCLGTCVSLTDQSLNGVSSWTWTSTAGNISSPNIQHQNSVCFNTVGTYTVKLKVENCTGGQDSISKVIDVLLGPTITISGQNTICVGENTSLSANGATSYTWDTGSNSNPLTVTPGVTTTYSVVGSLAGCTNTAQIAVTVNSVAPITASSNTFLCEGQSVILTASGLPSYTWSPSGSLNTTNSATVIATPTTATTYTILGASGTCTAQTTVIVGVNPTPILSIVASTNTICVGQNLSLTGNGASSYTWSPVGTLSSAFGTSVTATPTTTTAYTLTGSSLAGCTNTTQTTINITQPPILAISSTTICSGETATLTVNGASTYTWNTGSNSSSITITPTVTTTYSVTGSLATCTSIAQADVVVVAAPSISASSNTFVCEGQSVTLTASGLASYTWSPSGSLNTSNSATVIATPTTATTYTVYGGSGTCIAQTTVMVGINPTPTISIIAGSNTICAAQNVSLTGTGANSYTWSPAGTLSSATGTSVTATPTITTTYTLTGSSLAGCTNTTQTIINVAPSPTLAVSSTTICSGETATLTVNGASTYTWNTGSNSNSITITPTVTTTYSVTGSLATCTSIAQADVVVVSSPSISISSNTFVCEGQSVTLTASGLATYTWSPSTSLNTANSATVIATPTTATTYTVYGGSGTCVAQTTISVGINPTPTVSIISSTNTICAGENLSLTGTGANSYTWSPSGTLNSATGASVTATPSITTIYTLTGTSLAGCTNTAQTTISVAPSPTLAVSSTTICVGDIAILTASGASTYTWSTGSNSNSITITPTVTTTYSVTGSLATCTNIAQTDVVVVSSPSISVSSNTSVCLGQSVTLTVSGLGTYTWSPSNSLNTSNSGTVIATPTTATTYTIYGGSGTCVAQTTVMVGINPTPTINIIASSNTICAEQTLSLTATGANSYSWSPSGTLSSTFGTSVTATPNTTTTYTLIGTSLAGCTNTTQTTISVTPLPTLVVSSATLCAGQMATLTVNGASTYTWVTGSNSSSITVMPSVTTTYSVIGSLATCTTAVQTVVTIISTPSISITSNTSVCQGQSVTLTASGLGSYTWSPSNSLNTSNSATVIASPTTATTYTVYGGFGTCTAQNTVMVAVNTIPTVAIIPSANTVCAGQILSLIGTGANTYTWASSSNLSSAFGTSVTSTPSITSTYTLLGSSIAGCTNTTQTTINVTSLPTPSVSPATICNGQPATLIASGAGNYTWSPSGSLNTSNSATVIATPTTATTYTILGASGTCTAQTTVLVGVSPTPTVLIIASSNTVCPAQNIALTALGANSYTWSPAGNLSSAFGSPIIATPSITTTYTLIGRNLAGCTNTAQTTISITPTPTLSITSATICAGQTTTLTASGATTYTWSNGTHLNTLVVSPSISTNYNVIATNGGMCSSFGQASVTVVSYPNPISIVSHVKCNGLSNGTITINSSGATGFNWSPNTSTTNIATGLAAGVYNCTLSAGPGCNTIKTYTITQPSLLSGLPTYTNTTCGFCNGMAVSSPTGGTAPYHYNWQPNGITQNNLTDLCPGTYTLTVSDTSGCSATYSLDIQASPIFNATISASAYDIYPSELVLISSGTGSTYSWTPNMYLSGSSNSSVEVSPFDDAIFCVDITDSVGCNDTACVEIKVKCGEIFVPTAFSPNNDGHNDQLIIYGNCVEDLVFRVYDRWGEMVFETTSVQSKWDGTYKGSEVNAGVFVYQLEARLNNGERVSKKGNTTLVR